MDLLDVLIIYLACGAPFGMYQMMARRPVSTRNAAAFAALHLALWPFFATSALLNRIGNAEASTQRLFDERIDRIRAEMESIAFSNSPVSSVFEFREVFYRYAGLTDAAKSASDPVRHTSIAELNRSGSSEVAAACIARRNREKLQLHQTESRIDFVDAISLLLLETSRKPLLLSLAVRLAEHLQDRDAVDELNTLDIGAHGYPMSKHRTDMAENSRMTSTTV
jgi:hypothetical protein